jgi:WD40 repeat protein
MIAVACYGKLSIYRIGSTEPVKEFTWKGPILKVAWSPDGDFIATGNQDATVHFWYRNSGRDLEMSGYASKVRELSWDANSRLLATGGGLAVTVWRCSGKGPAGARPLELSGHIELISALSFQRKGALLASGGKDGRVCAWKIKDSGPLVGGIEFSSSISQLAWSGNDQLLAVGTDEGMVTVLNSS